MANLFSLIEKNKHFFLNLPGGPASPSGFPLQFAPLISAAILTAFKLAGKSRNCG